MSQFSDQKLPAHDWRLSVARQIAQWELGDAGWADVIIAAYCNCQQAIERLKQEQEA